MVGILVVLCCASVWAGGTTVIEEDFEQFECKVYPDVPFITCWEEGLIRWAHLYGKLEVVEEKGQGKILRIYYPKGKYGSEWTGSQFLVNLEPGDAYELSYKVKFEEGFDFRLGGKLPGLTSGGEKFTGGHHPAHGEGWSARFMWRKGGQAELYLYYVDKLSDWGDSHRLKGIVFETGKWYRIRQRVTLNDPDKANGRIKVWVNGTSVLDLQDLRLRIGEQGWIDSFYFSTFHGGNTIDWAPQNDSYARFDDLKIDRL